MEEKVAFISTMVGAANVASKTVGHAATLGRALTYRPTKFLLNAAKNDPAAVAMTGAIGAVAGPSMVADAMTATPEMLQRTAKRNALAQQLGKTAMQKVSSVLPSSEYVLEEMEKSAMVPHGTTWKSIQDFVAHAVGKNAEKLRAAHKASMSSLDARWKGIADGLSERLGKADDTAKARVKDVEERMQRKYDDAVRKAELRQQKMEADLREEKRKVPFTKIDEMMRSPGKLFLAGAMLSAGAAAGGGIGLAAGNGMGRVTEAYGRTKNKQRFSAMLRADPSLKGNPSAKKYFEVIQRASPYIASEPFVAAATVRSMLESPEGYATHPKFMQDILGIEERRQKTRFPSMRMPPLRGELPDMS